MENIILVGTSISLEELCPSRFSFNTPAPCFLLFHRREKYEGRESYLNRFYFLSLVQIPLNDISTLQLLGLLWDTTVAPEQTNKGLDAAVPALLGSITSGEATHGFWVMFAEIPALAPSWSRGC